MSALNQLFNNAKENLATRTIETPKNLEAKYNAMAKPSYISSASSDLNLSKAGQSCFFVSSKRLNASTLTKGFQSSDEFKDDLKALILKPAIIGFEAGCHGFNLVLKAWELLAHAVVALVDLADKTSKFDSKNLEETAADLIESGLKFCLYPWYATLEVGIQLSSLVVKSLFSLDDRMGENFNAAVNSTQDYINAAVNSTRDHIQKQFAPAPA